MLQLLLAVLSLQPPTQQKSQPPKLSPDTGTTVGNLLVPPLKGWDKFASEKRSEKLPPMVLVSYGERTHSDAKVCIFVSNYRSQKDKRPLDAQFLRDGNVTRRKIEAKIGGTKVIQSKPTKFRNWPAWFRETVPDPKTFHPPKNYDGMNDGYTKELFFTDSEWIYGVRAQILFGKPTKEKRALLDRTFKYVLDGLRDNRKVKPAPTAAPPR